jgi:hypothetical protein
LNANYDDVISTASHEIAKAILCRETDLDSRALLLDGDVRSLLRRIGLSMMQVVLSELGERAVRAVEQSGMKCNRHKTIPFAVLFGSVEVASPYFWNPVTHQSCRPVRETLGIECRGRSQAVERALSDFGAEESFGQAAKRFEEHYGWDVGRTTILRVVEAVAAETEQFVAARLADSRQAYEKPLAERPGVDRLDRKSTRLNSSHCDCR